MVLNQRLDVGKLGFEDGITSAQYQAVAKVPRAAANLHLSDLLANGCIARLPGGGRSIRYQVVTL